MTERMTADSGCPVGAERLDSLDGVSFIDPAIQQRPFAYYRTLREDAPIHFEKDLGMYLVSRHEDLEAVLRVFPRARLLQADGTRLPR
jgi:cytochrome P450